jgi:hypothetical protein
MNLYATPTATGDLTAVAPSAMSTGSQNNENSVVGFGFYTT